MTRKLSVGSRLGHVADISYLFSNDKDEVNDYVDGLINLGILTMSLTICWIIIVFVLCICGQRRVGFLSGKAFRRNQYFVSDNTSARDLGTHDNDNTNADVPNDNDDPVSAIFASANSASNQYKKGVASSSTLGKNQFGMVTTIDGGGKPCCGKDQSVLIRSTFVASGIIYIVLAILLVFQGIANIQQTVISVNEASLQTMNLLNKASGIITTTDQALKEMVNTTFPALKADLEPEVLCPNDPDGSSLPIVQQIQDNSAQIIAELQRLEEMILSSDDYLNDLASAVRENEETAESLYTATKDIKVNGWESILFVVINAVVVAVLIASAFLALSGSSTNSKLQCLVTWVFFPVFVLLVLLAAAVSAASVVIASANSDYCFPELYYSEGQNITESLVGTGATKNEVFFNSPDVTTLQVLQASGTEIGSDDYAIALFYITQCTAINPFDEIETFPTTLEELETSVIELINEVNATDLVQQLTAVCGRDFEGLEASLKQSQALLSVLSGNFFDLIEVIQCRSIVPIYQTIAYDAACNYSVSALFWIYSTSLLMTFFGFIMILFRASYCDTIYSYKYDTAYGRGGASVQNGGNNAMFDSNDDVQDANATKIEKDRGSEGPIDA